MSEKQRPSDEPEPTRLDSADLGGDPDATRADGGTPDASSPSKRLGDFDLLREIGRGGMGVVYEARQISLKRRVALKVLPPALGMSPQAKQRFEREARAAAKLHHTNIVPVHAVGEHDDHHFYAMELIEGESLDHVIRQVAEKGASPLMEATVTQAVAETGLRPGPSSREPAETSLSDTSAGGRDWIDAVAKLMAEVADGLDYAHGRGVIHRDIKPANLMLSKEGHLCLTDFGLARVTEEPGITVTGSFLGTPAYMSPEQIASGRIKIDHRTDIYSLGVVLYEMLTLRQPFSGNTREELLNRVLTQEPRWPRRINGKIPLDLETICLKALEKDPERRYRTAGELANDLRQYLQHGLISARRTGLLRRAVKWTRRHPTAALAIAGVLVVVAASVFAWKAGQRGEAAERLVADARLAFAKGDRGGLDLVDRALALDPDSVEAGLVRARLLITNSRYWEAADQARSVLRADPQEWRAHAILAGLALKDDLYSIDPGPHVQFVEDSAPESAEAYYLRAVGTKETRKRIELLDRALDLNPDDFLASVAKMNALAALSDFELELSEADRLIAIRPKSAQGWRFKSVVYLNLWDFDNARTAIERATEIDRRDPHNHTARADILWRTGEQDDALSELDRAIELNPENDSSYCNRARRLISMGRFEEAAADARKCIELNPDNRLGFSHLIQSFMNLERQDEARATIEELLARAEVWFDVAAKAYAYRTGADYYRELKDYDRAMELAERAIEIDPDDFRGYLRRMLIHRALGDDAGAEADCDAAAQIELDDPQSLFARANDLSFQCNRFQRSIEDYDRAIAQMPKWFAGYSMRGAAYHNLKDYEAALADMNKAIDLAPLAFETYGNRALLYREQGRFEEALAGQKMVLELAPYNGIAWSNYGKSLFDLGRLEEGLAAHEKAIELRPRVGLVWFRYGRSLFSMGRLEEALAAYEKAIELAGRFLLAHRFRAATLAWLGRCDDAATGFRKAVELAPEQTDSIMAWAHSSDYYACPDHYDLTAAVRHARSAYEADPEGQRNLLAWALFRSGDYAEAKPIMLELFAENQESSWFELAMCLWHLGETAEARRIYDASADWMKEHRPGDPSLMAIRQEAAEVLGIQQGF